MDNKNKKETRFKFLEFEKKIQNKLEENQISVQQYNEIVLTTLKTDAFNSYIKGDFDDALFLYGRMLNYNRSNEQPWVGQVASLIRAGRYEEAKINVDNGLNEFPYSSLLLAQKGVIYGYLNNRSLAFEYSDAAFEKVTSSLIYIYRGELLFIYGKNQEAGVLFYKAFENNENNLLFHFEIGLIYFQNGLYNNALFHLNKVIESTENNAFVLFTIGECHEKLGFKSKAETLYKQALVINPSFEKAHRKIVDTTQQPISFELFEELKLYFSNWSEIWKNKAENPNVYYAGFSSIVPTMGQIYNCQPVKALIFGGIFVSIIVIALLFVPISFSRTLQFLYLLPYIYVISILDAILTASLKRYGYIRWNIASLFSIAFFIIFVIMAFVSAYIDDTIISFMNVGNYENFGFKLGDRVEINKVVYNKKNPDAGDIVATGNRRQYYLYKIIATPGSLVEIFDNGNIYINGNLIGNYPLEAYSALQDRSFILSENKYLVFGMGYQILDKLQICGKITRIYYPPSRRRNL